MRLHPLLPHAPIALMSPPISPAPLMLSGASSALHLALPNALGTLLGFGLSYTIAAAACGGGRTSHASPSATRLLDAMRRENVPRVRTLSLAVAMALALAAGRLGSSIAMPSFANQVVYSVWFAMMAMVDEVYDTLPQLDSTSTALPAHIQALCWGLLLLPIPYLLGAQDVYKLFAMQFVGSQVMGAKLDLPEFKAAVALGLPVIALIAWRSGVALSSLSFLGMVLLSHSHVIYETHDERPYLMRLRAKLRWIPDWGWLVFNQHFQMVLLVLVGLLPSQWLCCVTAAYPVAKIGFAQGALSTLGRREKAAAPAEPAAVPVVASIPSRTLQVAMSAIRSASALQAVVVLGPFMLLKTALGRPA